MINIENPVRNYAISGVDSFKKYKKMCKILNSYPILSDKNFPISSSLFFDDSSSNEEFMTNWNCEIDITDLDLLTFDELVKCFYFSIRCS